MIIILKDVNGLELCAKFKEIEGYQAKEIIFTYPKEERSSIEKIKEESITIAQKPIKYHSLKNAIFKSLGSEKIGKVSQEDSITQNKSGPLNILLVDDDPSNRLIVKMFCKAKTSWAIDEAENGAICCEMIKQKNYDLVILDMQMPIMGGIEATRHIRAWEEENNLDPHFIVALTANVIPEQIEQCLQAGYSTHLGKPIKKDNLISFIEKFANNELKESA